MTDDVQTGTATPVVPTDETPAVEAGTGTVAAAPRTDVPLPDDVMDWSWPPYAPLEPAGGRRFDCTDWAPASTVRRPRLRLGRWTLLYRRGS